MMKKKSILFLVTEDWYFISHRLDFAIFLKKNGFDVYLCSKDTGKFKIILEKGIKCYDIRSRRKSLSAINFFAEVISFIKFAKKLKPNIIHLISLRPAVVGLFASLFLRKIKIFITFTGLGFIFIRRNLYAKILKYLIQLFFIIASRIKNAKAIVQNKDDHEFFYKNFFFSKDSISIIRGSGIDLNYFKEASENKERKIIISYVGRMLEDKGVHWLVKAFKLAKKKNRNIILMLAGQLDNENPTSIKKEKFKEIISFKGINYLGNIQDVRKVWKQSHIAVLLSKREGLPKSLMEAAAVGRPIIATDVPGCREIAINKFNAITVNPGAIKEIKEAILKLASDKSLRLQYGKNSRKIVEGDMENKKIFKKYLETYNNQFIYAKKTK